MPMLPLRTASLLIVFAGSLAWAADYTLPAEFRVLNTQQAPNPGAFTATIGNLPGDRAFFSGGAFEPLVFRTKTRAAADAPNEIIQGEGFFSTYASGFWDGAEVRVYRPVNGVLKHVRTDRIKEGGYLASGWMPVPEMDEQLVHPTDAKASDMSARATGGIDDLLDEGLSGITLEPKEKVPVGFQTVVSGFKPGHRYWYQVRAVTRDGRESAPSNVVTVRYQEYAEAKALRNVFEKFERPDNVPREGPPIPAPTRLKATLNGGLVTLSWQSVKAKSLAGYRLYVTDADPDNSPGNHLYLAGQARNDWEQIRYEDLVFISQQHDNFSRKEFARPMRWDRFDTKQGAYAGIKEFGDEMEGMRWQRERHPEPLPAEFVHGGDLCLRVDVQGEDIFSYGKSNCYANYSQAWYPVMIPGRTYAIEAWLRYRGDSAGRVVCRPIGPYEELGQRGGFVPQEAKVGDSWQKVVFTISPEVMLDDHGIGGFSLDLHGPGTWWADNVRFYDRDKGYLQAHPLVVRRARESGLQAIRFHTHIKSGHSMSMKMLLNPPGVMGARGYQRPNSEYTLHSLLDFCRQVGTNPWFQIEMCMSETEWHAFVEWLAAPYEPAAGDTPETKPWAYQRVLAGRAEPWADAFDRILFEISNETWNWMFGPWIFYSGGIDYATGKRYANRAEAYGMLQEYIVNHMRTSPYWTDELEAKFDAVLGGWSANADRENGYGAGAIVHSPSTTYLTQAGYNGGWDEGEKPAELTDESLFRSAMFWMQKEAGERHNIDLRDRLWMAGKAHRYTYGTYEAGPGYALPGLNGQPPMSFEQLEAQDMVGKSLATGVSTLDAFLGRAYLGYGIQNFFTLSFNRRMWTSHNEIRKGGHPYPSWLGLSLYNNQATGDFLVTETLSTPTWDMPDFGRRAGRRNAPLAGIYATRDGNRVNLFILSRKLDRFFDKPKTYAPGKGPNDDNKLPEVVMKKDQATAEIFDLLGEGDLIDKPKESKDAEPVYGQDDGFTPVTIHLPFTTARKVTLHTMTGDPRWHNLDEPNVTLQTHENIPFRTPFELTRETTRLDRDDLPPGSVFLYVFEGTDIGQLNHPPLGRWKLTPAAPGSSGSSLAQDGNAEHDPTVGTPVTFTSNANDPDGDRLTCHWTFGDQGTATDPNPTFTFTQPGNLPITLTVADDQGGRHTSARDIEVGLEAAGRRWYYRELGRGSTVSGSASASGDTIRLTGGGTGKSAQMSFLAMAQRRSGDWSFEANLTAVDGETPAWEAGLFLRQGLDRWGGDSAKLIVGGDGTVELSGGSRWRRRTDSIRGFHLPCRLRFERQGDELTGYASKDGERWERVGAILWPADKPAHAGLTVNSGHTARTARATFSVSSR